MSKKELKWKGYLAAFAVILVVISYAAYNFVYYEKGVKLNELYFISTGAAIMILSSILMSFFRNKIIKAILLFCGIFYAVLLIMYVYSFLFLNHAYAYVKWALFVGFLIGIIYVCHDCIFIKFITKHHHKCN